MSHPYFAGLPLQGYKIVFKQQQPDAWLVMGWQTPSTIFTHISYKPYYRSSDVQKRNLHSERTELISAKLDTQDLLKCMPPIVLLWECPSKVDRE